jgi:hypothetical protein
MKINTLIVVCIVIVASSCESYYFNNPQPKDSKNLYSIPKKYRGDWPLNMQNTHTLSIGKDYYSTNERITKSKSELDLDTNAHFIRDKIYFSEENVLQRGYDYSIKGDSIIIEVIEKTEINKNTFLRKIDYGYILNSRHPEMENWYKIQFVDTRNAEGVAIRELDREDLEKLRNYEILHENFNNYLIADWTKNEIQNFIDNGAFSDTICFLKYKERIKH